MAPQLKNMTMHTTLIEHESVTTVVDQSSISSSNDKSYKPLTDKSDELSKCETDSPEKSSNNDENINQSSSQAESDDIESTDGRSNNMMKKLRWASRIKVRPIKHVKSMSKREIKRIWYGDEEYRSFKIESQHTIQLVHESEDGQLDPEYETELCTRGLESALSARRNALRRRLESEAWDVVLDEQEYQKQNGKDSALYIAEVYKELSAWALEIAQIQALIDQEDVEREDQTEQQQQNTTTDPAATTTTGVEASE